MGMGFLAYGTMVKLFIIHLILFISFLTFNHPYYSIKSIKFFFFFAWSVMIISASHQLICSFIRSFIHHSYLLHSFVRSFVR